MNSSPLPISLYATDIWRPEPSQEFGNASIIGLVQEINQTLLTMTARNQKNRHWYVGAFVRGGRGRKRGKRNGNYLFYPVEQKHWIVKWFRPVLIGLVIRLHAARNVRENWCGLWNRQRFSGGFMIMERNT